MANFQTLYLTALYSKLLYSQLSKWFICNFAGLSDLYIYLLQVTMSSLGDHSKDTGTRRGRKCWPWISVNITRYRKTLQLRVVDLNVYIILCRVSTLGTKDLFEEDTEVRIQVHVCKTWVTLIRKRYTLAYFNVFPQHWTLWDTVL
jgi:hypothetical protein